MTPLISFIITYHNEPEDFLQACVGSIQALRLSADEAEIIVVDDGSETPWTMDDVRWTMDDGQRTMDDVRCTMYDGQRTMDDGQRTMDDGQRTMDGGQRTMDNGQRTMDDVELRVYRQEQAGLSVARNTGISHARGRYIQFVDADDCLIPSTYKAVLEQLRKEEADIILFKMTTASPQPSPKGREMSRSNSPLIWRGQGRVFLQHRNLRAAAWGYAFRRETLGELRFYPGLYHEDELFTPQLFLRAQSLCELDVKAYFYRQHEGTITHSDEAEKTQKRLNDIHFIIKQLQSQKEPLLERRIRQLTVDYLQKSWTLTNSIGELRKRVHELRTEGVLPLPLRRYSMRYLFVASIANLI